MRYPIAIVLLILFLLPACKPAPSLRQRTLYVFGTLVTISAWTADGAGFERAVDRIDQSFQRLHREWHAWRGDGRLMRLNRALAAGESLRVDEDLLALLRLGQRLYRRSGGLFDPAIGGLIALWGFHRDEPPAGPPPDPARIAEWLRAAPNMGDLRFAGNEVSSVNPRVALDLGAYAKGYALRRALDLLREAGISNAIVNAGGDLCVSGRRDGRRWRIGVRNPFRPGVIAALAARDGECIMTSGNYERYREYEGVRYAHIIDSRTGYPVAHVVSATVIARDGALADAAATALSVAGPTEWRRVARDMGISQALLVDESGRVMMTGAMARRIGRAREAEEGR